MPPVLSMSGSNYDYDYDTIQPYFMDEETFYPPSLCQLLPGPGEDIWKKFELLPTPPLSPSRAPSPSNTSLSAADHLEEVSNLLDKDFTASETFLQSFIIQDCMWSSSFPAAEKLEKVLSERLVSLKASSTCSTSAVSSLTGAAAVLSQTEVNPEYLRDLQAAAAHCIDPSVVFPCSTVSEKQSICEEQMEVGPELCLDSPPLSSSDNESEDEEEENCEEEIDVVTVERQKTPRRCALTPLVLKRSHINIHQHNYAAKQPAAKRPKAESAGARQSRRCWSPRSDGEDSDKRMTHNVLERQRRNELRMSFLTLRDEVPAVANNDKAAKVVILRKATEFIKEIRGDERKLVTTKEELRKRSRELKRRLEQLRTLH
uniref:Transcriptional regulator n=1 Tax=Oryzias latipes TaxID=8090 RepID=A0A3P9I280_ORYLA